MGVDYSWGVGYGIAVPLEDDMEERLIPVLNDFFGTDVDPEDGIHEFNGTREVVTTGLSVDWAGNSWSGADQHALILVEGAGSSGDMNEVAGVRVLGTGTPARVGAIMSVMHELLETDIDFHGPGWMAYGSVT